MATPDQVTRRLMRDLRVLMACDIATNGTGNPYTLQLLHALEAHPRVDAVQHGTSWMRVPEVRFDVVHIQWPEGLTGWDEPSEEDLRVVRSVLERWSDEAAVVVTAHNEYPHYRDTPAFRALYQMVYQYADGIVHMGKVSRKIVHRRYGREVEGARETIIPHGNYAWFPDRASREEARSALAVEEDANLVLSFGIVRATEELEFLRHGFGTMRVPRRRLLVVGTLPHRRTRFDWRYWAVRVPAWLHPRMELCEMFVPPDEVQIYFNAADVVIIPRLHVLNSGNLSLGFSFGRVVVGPDEGVVGEVLRETGNPVFDPAEPSTLGEALDQGIALAREGHGRLNRTYASEEMSWDDIADQHVRLYATLAR